jgi:hypothetical protein
MYFRYPNYLVQCNDMDLFIWLMSCEGRNDIIEIANLIELLGIKEGLHSLC